MHFYHEQAFSSFSTVIISIIIIIAQELSPQTTISKSPNTYKSTQQPIQIPNSLQQNTKSKFPFSYRHILIPDPHAHAILRLDFCNT
jgi:hypothetical protein